jgi:hypothetical protein
MQNKTAAGAHRGVCVRRTVGQRPTNVRECSRDALARARRRLQRTSDVRVASGLHKSSNTDAISKSLNAYGSRKNPVKETVDRMSISGSSHMLMRRRDGCKRILEKSAVRSRNHVLMRTCDMAVVIRNLFRSHRPRAVWAAEVTVQCCPTGYATQSILRPCTSRLVAQDEPPFRSESQTQRHAHLGVLGLANPTAGCHMEMNHFEGAIRPRIVLLANHRYV